MLKITLSLFLIGHFLGDFYLQTNTLAKNKEKSFNKLLIHSFIYFITMTIVTIPIFGFTFFKWTVFLSLIHFLIDLIKSYLSKNNIVNNRNENLFFIIDQLLHFLSIITVVLMISLLSNTVEYTNFFNNIVSSLGIDVDFTLSWFLAIIFIMKPASITIKKILRQYQPITVDIEEKGHPNAGALIGVLERLIIFIMLSQNQYVAIGFVLTSKSIARYNKIVENLQFSEYYLLGTLLSILLVILTYIIII